VYDRGERRAHHRGSWRVALVEEEALTEAEAAALTSSVGEAVVDEGDEERLFRRIRGASESGARVAAANAEGEVELLGPARQEPADPESDDEEETTGVHEADPAAEVRELPSPSKEGTLSVAEKLLPASAEVGSEAAQGAKDIVSSKPLGGIEGAVDETSSGIKRRLDGLFGKNKLYPVVNKQVMGKGAIADVKGAEFAREAP
jgi:hypothetical protein